MSLDNGDNWQYIGLKNINITSIAVSSHGNIFAGTRGNGIFILSSLNKEWIIADPALNYQTFSSLLVKSENIVFAGGTGVFRSDDNGKYWNLKNKGLGNWPVYSLILDKRGNIDAGTDNGGSWINSNEGLTNTELTSLAINDIGHIFAGTWRGGIYRSINDGKNWAAVDSGLTNKEVFSLIIPSDNYLYAGTFKGLFRTSSKL